MTIVLPHGVLFRGGEEGNIRKNLLEKKHIRAVIGLPANIFFGTGIPTIIMVLGKARTESSVLMVDASKHFIKEGKNNKLQASDIKRIVDVVTTNKTVEGFSRLVSLDEIRANDYNLNIPRYVDSSEPAETWDIYATMFGGIPKNEIAALDKYWAAWPTLKAALFIDNGTSCMQLNTDNIANTVKTNAQVVEFQQNFAHALTPLKAHLKTRLLTAPEQVDPLAEEVSIANKLAAITDNFTLCDSYVAYQELDDAWAIVSVDLEIISTEGPSAINKVDPNMVIKKNKGKDTVTQDGWVGRVLPFELVQQHKLTSQLEAINNKTARIQAIDAQLEQHLEDVAEEDKQSPCLDAEGVTWVPAEVAKRAKSISAKSASDFEQTLLSVNSLIVEQKQLKKSIKVETVELADLTKQTIEALSADECIELLAAKWIDPLFENLQKIPHDIVDDFTNKIQKLANKYSATYSDICNEIKQCETELVDMIDQLTGNQFDMAGLAELKLLLGGE
jgi:type I restriction enzyme M protein